VSQDIDTQMMLDFMDSGMTEAEAYAEMKKYQEKAKKKKTPPEPTIRIVPEDRKPKGKVMARAGGMMKSIDGIAQRGKTRAKR
jgi:hypothetical protein